MKKIQIINGPNLNLLGKREPTVYGNASFEDYLSELRARFPQCEISYYQSNVEGEIINKIHEVGFEYDGIVLNAGAYTHTSIALHDAIKAVTTPVVEVHISNVHARYVRAKAYIAQKQANKALADLKELSKDTRTVHGAEAKYLLAQLYYDTNDDKNAEKVLMNFIENGTPHQYWLARGFILLADIYIRQGDDFQARQYLTSLQNNYKGDDDIAGMIENRLGKLKN